MSDSFTIHLSKMPKSEHEHFQQFFHAINPNVNISNMNMSKSCPAMKVFRTELPLNPAGLVGGSWLIFCHCSVPFDTDIPFPRCCRGRMMNHLLSLRHGFKPIPLDCLGGMNIHRYAYPPTISIFTIKSSDFDLFFHGPCVMTFLSSAAVHVASRLLSHL